MAGCDYYACDRCGGKTFYDAELDYPSPEFNSPEVPKLLPKGAGEMLVLCPECAKDWRLVMVEGIEL